MENTLKLLDQTVEDCDVVATCHYIQAEDDKRNIVRYGLPSLIINVLVSSVLVADLGKRARPHEVGYRHSGAGERVPGGGANLLRL